MGATKPKIIVIVGPTASGKTRLAVALARMFNGEIVSADSRQIYRGMTIGTGKDLSEYKKSGSQAAVPYHGIDIASPQRTFTVAQYQRYAYRTIDDIIKRKKTPIVCGGSGLYISSIIEGLEFPGEKTRRAVAEFRKNQAKQSLPQLLVRLKKIDRVTFERIDHRNRRRVERALEIYFETGQPKSKVAVGRTSRYDVLLLGLQRPAEQLRQSIHTRLHQRFTGGLVREVSRLRAQGISWKRLEGFGLEYRWVAQFIEEKLTRAELLSGLETAIWQFARRQATWFRRYPNIVWISRETDARKKVRAFLN